MSVAVIVATYGDSEEWAIFAQRALESVRQQTRLPEESFWSRGDTLQAARNGGAENASSEWLIFLDADDTLHPGYVEAMLQAEGDIRYPSTLGVVSGLEDNSAVVAQPRDLRTGNYITIGAMIRCKDFLEVGGFRDLPCLEDWDLFLRLWLNGAEIVPVPKAIYKITVRPNSRNKDEDLHMKTYQSIRRRYSGWTRSA